MKMKAILASVAAAIRAGQLPSDNELRLRPATTSNRPPRPTMAQLQRFRRAGRRMAEARNRPQRLWRGTKPGQRGEPMPAWYAERFA